jgi:hypothetical protein
MRMFKSRECGKSTEPSGWSVACRTAVRGFLKLRRVAAGIGQQFVGLPLRYHERGTVALRRAVFRQVRFRHEARRARIEFRHVGLDGQLREAGLDRRTGGRRHGVHVGIDLRHGLREDRFQAGAAGVAGEFVDHRDTRRRLPAVLTSLTPSYTPVSVSTVSTVWTVASFAASRRSLLVSATVARSLTKRVP